MTLLAEQLREKYEEDGCLHLRGVLTEWELEPVRQLISGKVDEIARDLHEQEKLKDLHAGAPFAHRLAAIAREADYKANGWNHAVFGKAIYDLLTTPALLDLVEALIGPEIAVNGDYWIRPKLPQSVVLTLPWHQDSAYYGAQTATSHIISIWIPLVNVDEHNGCMQYIPGSHRWGFLETQPDQNRFKVPLEDVEARGDVKTLRMSVGDVFVFHNLTLHRSQMNHSDSVRWSIDLRYSSIGTDVTWLNELKYYGFVARSQANPGSAESWEEWRAKWEGT
jgi:phytanoyl-CoA hydroxylase